MVNALDIQQLLTVLFGKTVPEQCDINWMDKWTDFFEESAQVRVTYANIQINDPPVPRLHLI